LYLSPENAYQKRTKYENQQYEQTLLELRMISLLPEESIRMLDELFGDPFRELPELERVILITAATEGSVQHTRVKEISLEHSKDISSALAHLVQQKMLEKEGETRCSIYHLPGKQVSGSAQLFYENNELNSPDNELNFLDVKKSFLWLWLYNRTDTLKCLRGSVPRICGK
jgi:hypothetical protein